MDRGVNEFGKAMLSKYIWYGTSQKSTKDNGKLTKIKTLINISKVFTTLFAILMETDEHALPVQTFNLRPFKNHISKLNFYV